MASDGLRAATRKKILIGLGVRRRPSSEIICCRYKMCPHPDFETGAGHMIYARTPATR